jgi:DNA-binding protein HU-beta
MNKTELAKAMADKSTYNVSAAVAEDMVNAFMAVVKEAVAKDEKVQLVGFGTFEATERAARTGKNPQTGEPLEIPACKVPKFKPGKAFKEALK